MSMLTYFSRTAICLGHGALQAGAHWDGGAAGSLVTARICASARPCTGMQIHNTVVLNPVKMGGKGPLEFRNACSLSVHKGGIRNINPGMKEYESDNRLDVPQLITLKSPASPPCSCFQKTMDVEFISSHNVASKSCFD